MSSTKAPQRRHRFRRTIGFLTASLCDPYATATWADIMTVAAAHDANVVNLVTGRLKSPSEFEAPAQALFDLVDGRQFDGLVIFGRY